MNVSAQKNGQKYKKTYLGAVPRLGKVGEAMASLRKGRVQREEGGDVACKAKKKRTVKQKKNIF